MPTDQSKAIVLRIVEFSETSLVVTLLTRDLGRVTAIAKGARRPRGPFEGALDLLAVCRVVVIRKRTDTLNLLTEAKLLRRFRGAERSLERTYAGYYLAEILRLVTEDDDPQPELYELAIRVLQSIDGTGNVAIALAYFDAQWLRLVGWAAATDRCASCHGDPGDLPRLPFSLESGGMVCRDCRRTAGRTVSARREVVRALGRLQRPGLETIPSDLEPGCYGELRDLMNRYIQDRLGLVPRLQTFLPTAIRTEPTA